MNISLLPKNQKKSFRTIENLKFICKCGLISSIGCTWLKCYSYIYKYHTVIYFNVFKQGKLKYNLSVEFILRNSINIE